MSFNSPFFHAAKLLLFFDICKFLCVFFAFFLILVEILIFYTYLLKSKILHNYANIHPSI